MSENHPDGFLRHPRRTIGYRDARSRARDYRQIYALEWDQNELSTQGQRCMDCGVPTCMGGCPIGNLIPEWNDLVYRGLWEEALARLHATNNFPEFTGYTCPAPCEPACTLASNDDAVTIKDIERAIVDRGWEEGWIVPRPPNERTGKRVAVVGSGPAGLAAAQQLNRAGHRVTVFERNDVIGGLMVYGIPDFKFAKHMVERRVQQLRDEGIDFRTGVNIGVDVPLAQLQAGFDAVCLAIGALRSRDVAVPGRDLDGILFGMEYLTAENRRQAGRPVDGVDDARGRRVVVLGGGDTGADCVATAHRQGARKVLQVSINPRPPEERPAHNPWPQQPQTYRRTYALEEGGEEAFSLNVAAFVDTDGDGRVDRIECERVDWNRDRHGRRTEKILRESGIGIPADLVLIAIGFEGPELAPLHDARLTITQRNVLETDERKMSSIPGVFVAGDASRGQSIVVWAIGEGRDVARQIDAWLMGTSRLPASLQTPNPPSPQRGL
ncbi:Glutamate synthase [NADPH] small chain [Thioalkalivibrio nitratireducens DSM 14787]|uniref:Glutamate synthase [NADPH] small chain n=1 Tax=Thioalkalivibrio nitratireducens (strain DSM 14787 / UNIQEM 213 / ALEN2) TaxID=1255043 RepID=L0DTJ0_THIND|nr:glutamate synthase subunit beta [Thioalkalivibrio nitratireducens]AGA32315.1 Glutamate synthase [NADPH] small chain [Thioalkalivibrio nitratireducens DSM 14787]